MQRCDPNPVNDNSSGSVRGALNFQPNRVDSSVYLVARSFARFPKAITRQASSDFKIFKKRSLVDVFPPFYKF